MCKRFYKEANHNHTWEHVLYQAEHKYSCDFVPNIKGNDAIMDIKLKYWCVQLHRSTEKEPMQLSSNMRGLYRAEIDYLVTNSVSESAQRFLIIKHESYLIR